MRKVVHIITGLNDGGAESSLFNLCRQDGQDRHEVISLGSTGKYGPLLEEIGIPVTCLDMPRGRVTLAGLRGLWRALRGSQADAVQTWMYHADLLGGVVGRLTGQRNISWGIHHSDLGQAGTSRKTVAVARLCALLSHWIPRNIICCAEKSANVHKAFGYDVRRMKVVPNGYDLSVFRPDEVARASLRSELALSPEQSVIGFVARYDPLKDHGNLLGALALLKRQGLTPTCILVGTGMETDNRPLMADIERFGVADQLRLMGRRNDIPAVMNALDLHVMSSASEAFPNVLAEAMACGTPSVSTDVGDAGEILGETGWIAPTRDPAALANAIRTAIEAMAEPDWEQRKQAARQRVETRFSIQRMVEGYRSAWIEAHS